MCCIVCDKARFKRFCSNECFKKWWEDFIGAPEILKEEPKYVFITGLRYNYLVGS